jgi:hypothetical protein
MAHHPSGYSALWAFEGQFTQAEGHEMDPQLLKSDSKTKARKSTAEGAWLETKLQTKGISPPRDHLIIAQD